MIIENITSTQRRFDKVGSTSIMADKSPLSAILAASVKKAHTVRPVTARLRKRKYFASLCFNEAMTFKIADIIAPVPRMNHIILAPFSLHQLFSRQSQDLTLHSYS